MKLLYIATIINVIFFVVVVPDSKVHGAIMGPKDGPHNGPMNLAIRDVYIILTQYMCWYAIACSYICMNDYNGQHMATLAALTGCGEMVCWYIETKMSSFDEILFNGYTGSYYFDNFQSSQWYKYHQNEDISVSMCIVS